MLPTKQLELAACPFSGRAVTQDTNPFQMCELKKPKKKKGGCPVMTSLKKRNPPLDLQLESFDVIYQSQFQYLFDHQGFLTPHAPKSINRTNFDAYPVYLKHTIFHEEAEMSKIRQLEVSQRFFIHDQYREQGTFSESIRIIGNKAFNNQDYHLALRYYERALSCYRWLEVLDESEKPQELVMHDGEESKQQDASDDFIRQQEEDKKALRKKYKTLLTVFDDSNVVLKGDENPQEEEFNLDMRESLLFSLYLNMSAAYMRLSHFSLAKQVLADARKIKERHSQVMFRSAQAIVFDKWSSYSDLLEAEGYVTTALELWRNEKIFQQDQNMLKMMNLHNVPNIYKQLHAITQKRLEERLKWETDAISGLFENEKEREEICKEMIESGRVPEDLEGLDFVAGELDHQEYEIVKNMMVKYYQVIEFHSEQKRSDQVRIANEQLQDLLVVYSQMKFFMTLDLQSQSNLLIEDLKERYQIDLSNHIVQKRLSRLCRERVRDLFEEGRYNLEMYKIALSDYFKRKKEKEEQNTPKPNNQGATSKYAFSSQFGMQMLFAIMFFFIALFALRRSNLNKWVLGWHN